MRVTNPLFTDARYRYLHMTLSSYVLMVCFLGFLFFFVRFIFSLLNFDTFTLLRQASEF